MSEPLIVEHIDEESHDSKTRSRLATPDNSSCTLVSGSLGACSSGTTMAYNESVEQLRETEYPMLKGKTYLDHAGTTIYAKSLIENFSTKLITNLYGNPHSSSHPSQLSGHVVDSIREKALAFFNAGPEHFDIIFVANATAAIKMVGECFRDLASASPMSSTFWYGYHKDAHSSVIGIRELTKGNHRCFASDEEVERWLNSQNSSVTPSNSTGPGLFCFPGQSNMTGRRLPLSWMRKLRESHLPSHQNTYSLLDAAALATTTQLDFSDPDSAPDFTAVSFYKIFGFPDLGALIVKKDSGHILGWRKYFGGGTVNSVTVFHEPSVQRKDTTLHDALEDGTLPFHNIIALGCAIDVHKSLYGSMKNISQHTSFLSSRLYGGMANIKHSNGVPLCVIYNDVGHRCEYGDPVTQGATIAFNIVNAEGSYIGHSVVEKLADEKDIFLRSGGLCNAGGIASYLKYEHWQIKRAWSAGHRCGEEGIDVVNGKPTGVVRASLGAMSTIGDVDKFLDFLAEAFVELPQKVVQREEADGLKFRPTSYEIRKNTGHETTMSAVDFLESADPKPAHASVPRRVVSTTSLAHISKYTKRSTNEQRLPSVASSDRHHSSVSQKNENWPIPAGLIGSVKHNGEILRGERPWVFQDPAQTTKEIKKKRSLRFWKRANTWSPMAGA